MAIPHPKNTAEHYKALIDDANENGRWLILWCHSWEIDQWDMVDVMEEVVAYAAENARVVTCKEANERIGNTIDQTSYSNPYDDQFVIQNNGVVKSNIAKTKLVAPNTHTYTTAPSEFDCNYASICVISGENATDFPYGQGGILITYAFSPSETEDTNRLYYYQTFAPDGKNELLYRGARSRSSWASSFKRTTTVSVTTEERLRKSFYKVKGETVFDSTLGILVIWNGSDWVDALGNKVDVSNP